MLLCSGCRRKTDDTRSTCWYYSSWPMAQNTEDHRRGPWVVFGYYSPPVWARFTTLCRQLYKSVLGGSKHVHLVAFVFMLVPSLRFPMINDTCVCVCVCVCVCARSPTRVYMLIPFTYSLWSAYAVVLAFVFLIHMNIIMDLCTESCSSVFVRRKL